MNSWGTGAYSKSSSTPWRATADLRKVGELCKSSLVSQRDVDDTVMSQRRHGCNGRALLSATWGTSGDEDTGILAPVGAGGPLATGGIPESLPLSREVTITGWHTEEECVLLINRQSRVDDYSIRWESRRGTPT
jgi:hypothetical protein